MQVRATFMKLMKQEQLVCKLLATDTLELLRASDLLRQPRTAKPPTSLAEGSQTEGPTVIELRSIDSLFASLHLITVLAGLLRLTF